MGLASATWMSMPIWDCGISQNPEFRGVTSPAHLLLYVRVCLGTSLRLREQIVWRLTDQAFCSSVCGASSDQLSSSKRPKFTIAKPRAAVPERPPFLVGETERAGWKGRKGSSPRAWKTEKRLVTSLVMGLICLKSNPSVHFTLFVPLPCCNPQRITP